ncbi:MAG: type 1 periplasmic binding fold superfamily protein [Lewinella sp.]
MTRHFFFILAICPLFFATSCDDEDPILCDPCEEELITRVTWTLTPSDANNEVVSFSFVDADGDGGNAPVLSSTGTLVANATYDGVVSFANEDELIDPEIMEEDEDHQVFYLSSANLDISVAYDDMDSDGNPLGLLTTVTTGAASVGDVQIILRHEPMKGSMSTIDNPAIAGGETDVEVTFDATIQ